MFGEAHADEYATEANAQKRKPISRPGLRKDEIARNLEDDVRDEEDHDDDSIALTDAEA